MCTTQRSAGKDSIAACSLAIWTGVEPIAMVDSESARMWRTWAGVRVG
jgi:hypothetical protein